MPSLEEMTNAANGHAHKKQEQAIEFAHQAENLAHLKPSQEDDETGSTHAVAAKFVTDLDPVVETANGGRLPAIPVEEAEKLNALKEELGGPEAHTHLHPNRQGERRDAPLSEAVSSSRTNPLFPPLPVYGPPSLLRSLQSWFFRVTSAYLSLAFLLTIFAATLVAEVPKLLSNIRRRAMLQNPKKRRPFYAEEVKRKKERKAAERAWVKQKKGKGTNTPSGEKGTEVPQDGEFVPTEGGPDLLRVDIPYYARRVGLDAEVFEVQTEDGFIIELWHIFNPREYKQPPADSHKEDGPDVFEAAPRDPGIGETQPFPDTDKKYPILMMHGLLQSAGAFCCNDDDSLAFYLAKSGYDVWLGNNRCGFNPKHTMLDYTDPRMWAWNIRQMGVLDLAALISRVLTETGFPRLALIAHSQGTTQTFVALAKEQRPEIGEKISVFCALAPAAYAGPLIGKIYFKVMRLIGPAIFRIIFGIHAFIPLMMIAHKVIPAKPYGWLGYHVFSFLFNWSDKRWERDLRDRMFQWAPVYVSAESMRWWLGRECFARQKCILATRQQWKVEDQEDEEDDEIIRKAYIDREPHVTERRKLQRNVTSFHCQTLTHQHHDSSRGKFAWYNDQFPPLALWVCGADDLVDGRRLLRRFDRGREPHVRIVHKKVIEDYEHLDVIWAMDAIEKCGKEVREVIWRTIDLESAAKCRVPVGCEKPLEEDPDISKDVPMLHSGGRLRMASISEAGPPPIVVGGPNGVTISSATQLDESIEEEGEHGELAEGEKIFNRRLSEAHFTDLQEKENPLAAVS